MNERETRTPQPKAMRPSQQRLVEEDLKLPARLTHLRHLPWAECYKRQLHAENKSINTPHEALEIISELNTSFSLEGGMRPIFLNFLFFLHI